MSDYKLLFTPKNIGNCTIKNRIVMSPMLVGFGTIDGTATDKLLDYYEERAKGGTGLIITEITRVNDKTGAGAFAQLAASHDYHIAGLKKLADRIHAHDAKVFVQLHHPGRQNVGLLVGTVPLSIKMQKIWPGYTDFLYKITPTIGKKLIAKNIVPSSVCPSKVEPSYFAGGHVRALRKGEIHQLVNQFAEAALRVKKAGCDGVELHASHGYLLQQFLSPNTNRRTDEYGGSLENRMRFILEIIQKSESFAALIFRSSSDLPWTNVTTKSDSAAKATAWTKASSSQRGWKKRVLTQSTFQAPLTTRLTTGWSRRALSRAGVNIWPRP